MFGPGRALDPPVRASLEQRFGEDLSDITVHTGARAAASAHALQADAFTVGSRIGVAAGRHEPSTAEGRELLTHEVVHALQQRRGGPATLMGQPSTTTAPSVGDPLRVLGPYTAGDIHLSGGEIVTAVAERHGLTIRVTLPAPYARAGEPFDMPLAMLEPAGPTPSAATTFQVTVLTEQEFEAQFGLPAAILPEGRAISGESLPSPEEIREQSLLGPGAGSGMLLAPMPGYPLPANAVGIQWTQFQAGHLSIFAETGGTTVQRGFRGTFWAHATAGSRLNVGVPGAMRNDILFRWLPNQTVVYRPADPQAAIDFARELGAIEHRETYRFPPRPGTENAPPCRNCITVPRRQVIQALGQEPVIVDPAQGPVDVTRAGRPAAGQPLEPAQAGRGATIREYLAQPDPFFEEQGLRRVRVPNATIAARGGVVFIKGAGGVLMLYGAVQTTRRLSEAHGTPQFGLVASQEAGAWVGGLIAGALGSAAVGALVCSPSGPGAFVCAAAGFAGGLVFGTLGAAGGARVGEYVYRTATEGPRAGYLAFPTVYTFFIDMFIDMESLDPAGAQVVRKAYAGDPQAVDQFMHGITGVPYLGGGF